MHEFVGLVFILASYCYRGREYVDNRQMHVKLAALVRCELEFLMFQLRSLRKLRF